MNMVSVMAHGFWKSLTLPSRPKDSSSYTGGRARRAAGGGDGRRPGVALSARIPCLARAQRGAERKPDHPNHRSPASQSVTAAGGAVHMGLSKT